MNTELSTEFPNRLHTLSDGRPGLRGALHVEITDPGPEIKNQNSKTETPPAAILDFISSDETLDRYDEIIVASGWRLENYLRNPVFQNSHQYGDILFTLGKALITEIRTRPSSLSSLPSPYLFQRIEFAVDANPMARIAYGLYKSKFLSAVSVGFIPLRWQNASDAEGSAERSDQVRSPVVSSLVVSGPLVSSPVVRSPVVSGPVFRRKYLEQELLEVSAVAIPANPSALALALKSGAVEKSDLRETLDLFRATLSHPMGEGRPALRSAFDEGGGDGPQLRTPHAELRTASGPTLADYLPLARTLRDLLRH